jgi:formate dehydrogenase major subunit
MNTMKRRTFLKSGVAALVGTMAPESAQHSLAMGRGPVVQPLQPDKVVDSCCQFCQVRCRLRVSVKDGRVILIEGHPENTWTGGSMCPKGRAQMELVNSEHRLLHPMIRKDGGWERVSYAQALELVEAKLRESRKKADYKQRVALMSPLWDCREGEIAAALMMESAGYSYIKTPGETCISSASNTLAMMLGTPNSTTTIDELMNTKLLLLWGANLAETLPPYARWIVKARENGTRVIYIDCRGTHTSNLADKQIYIRPGTDGVLAMGILKLLIEKNLFDAGYVAAQVRGLDSLANAVTSYDPGKVASITGIPAEDVVALAEAIGKSPRTILWLGGCLSRYSNGMQTIRALISMQGITGRLLGPGNGIITMEGGKPGGEGEFIEHYADHDLPPELNMRRLTKAMEKGDIDVLFLNSSYRRYPDCNSVRDAIKKVGFVVFRGHFMNEEAELAHVIIPTPFGLESDGTLFGAERQVFWREASVPPRGEVVADWKFYSDLGRRLMPDVYPKFGSAAELYEMFRKAVPSWHGITLERLKSSHSGIIWPCPSEDAPESIGSLFTEGKLLTPDGGLDLDISVLGPLAWQKPKGSPESGDDKFPLTFTQGKAVQHWQQSLTNYSSLLAQFNNGREIFVHPRTAETHGVADGDMVRIVTETGELRGRMKVVNHIVEDIIFTASHFSPLAPFPENRGDSINTAVPNHWDRVSAQFNGFGCRLEK